MIKFFNHLDSFVLSHYKIPLKTQLLISKGIEKIILDFTEVEFVNSSMLGMISSILKHGKQVSVVCQNRGFVYDLLEKCALLDMIHHRESIYDAVYDTVGE